MAVHLEMTTGSVLDILIYVFDRYMLVDAPAVPRREYLARDLERVGFAPAKVERALDWLTALAFGQERRSPTETDAPAQGVRVFSDGELMRLSTECRGLLLTLERARVLTPQQREIVIERLLALDGEELSLEQVKWVVLMVLTSKAGDAAACERFADLVEPPMQVPH